MAVFYFEVMSNMSQFRKRNSIIVLLLGCLIGGFTFFSYIQEKRSKELQKSVNELELETDGSKSTLSKDEFLSLKKDIATLKKERFASQDSAWLVLFQTLGTVGVVGGLLVTWNGQSIEREYNKKEFEAANERLISERFFSAVELLSGDNRSSCLGGIYTLDSIAAHSSDYKRRTIRILLAYIKDKSPYPSQLNSKQQENIESRITSPDI